MLEHFHEEIDALNYEELQKAILSNIETRVFAEMYDGTEEQIDDLTYSIEYIEEAMKNFIKNKK